VREESSMQQRIAKKNKADVCSVLIMVGSLITMGVVPVSLRLLLDLTPENHLRQGLGNIL